LRHFLDFADAASVCEAAGLSFVRPMHTGTLSSCLDCPCEFDSTVPATHGLPSLDEPNLAEGVVIRPEREPRGSGERGLFKQKIQAFLEKR